MAIRKNVKKVVAWETSDGQTHANQVLATAAEHAIELRGFFNTVVGQDNMSTTTAAKIITKHRAQLVRILKRQENEMNRATGIAKQLQTKAEKVEKANNNTISVLVAAH